MREEAPKQRLLARQTSLLRYLTDPAAYDVASSDAAFAAMDEERLRLIGRMSLSKRMDKIRTALPRTFTYVPHVENLSEAEFASQFPPYTNLRYDNAKQFVEYLRHLWTERPMEPTFLPDLAAVEAAVVKVNAILPETDDRKPGKVDVPLFRLARNIELLNCGHDVRTFFAGGAEREPPVERSVSLVVGTTHGGAPRICEISSKVFDFLTGSADWRRLDVPEIRADRELPGLVNRLIEMQVIEVVQ